jgi:mRNA-degrading endonuclease RelE of RelBE toxin-antitoxin system
MLSTGTAEGGSDQRSSTQRDLQTDFYLGDELAEELAGFSSYKPGRYRILYKFDEERNVIDVYVKKPECPARKSGCPP